VKTNFSEPGTFIFAVKFSERETVICKSFVFGRQFLTKRKFRDPIERRYSQWLYLRLMKKTIIL